MTIVIVDDGSYNAEEEQEQIDNLAPIPSIFAITQRGELEIRWDRSIKIPRNLTKTKETNATYQDPVTFKIREVPSLFIEILPGQDSREKDLYFTWYYTSWEYKKITI